MRILIIGAEQLGYFLSKSLVGSGHKVTIIDSDPVRCEQIANTFDVTTFCGDGTRVETLAAAGAGKCDVLIAVTNRDEDNLIACELGKRQFGIDRTIAQSNNSKNIEIEGSSVKFVADIENSNAVISEYHIPETWTRSGTALKDLAVPADCVLIYIMRGGLLFIPRGGTLLMAGDDVTALTVGLAGRQLRKLFEI